MPWRPQFRFRLATLLVVITAICLWLGVITHRARSQKEAIAVLSTLGAKIRFDYQDNGPGNVLDPDADIPGPAWARRYLGNDYFRTVVDVDLWKINDGWNRP